MAASSTKIFLINLKSSKDRRVIMENQLKKLNLPYEIFEATKGSDLSGEEIEGYYDKDYYKKKPDYFTPGMAGCTISHYLLYKKIVEEKIDVALILEDDMVISDQLPALLRRLSDQVKNDEVIMLFYQSYFPISLSQQHVTSLTSKYDIYQVIDIKGLRSTGGYLINQEGAKRMAEKIFPFSAFPDEWKSFYERKIINGVRVVYPFLLDNTYEGTTISPNKKGGIVVTKIIPFLDKKRIFPFHQLLRWRRKRNIENTRKCIFKNEIPTDFREN